MRRDKCFSCFCIIEVVFKNGIDSSLFDLAKNDEVDIKLEAGKSTQKVTQNRNRFPIHQADEDYR